METSKSLKTHKEFIISDKKVTKRLYKPGFFGKILADEEDQSKDQTARLRWQACNLSQGHLFGD